MSWVRSVYVVWMLLAALLHTCNVESCTEEERLALLDLNSYFRSKMDASDSKHFRGLGQGENDEHNCCTWWRVECNSTTQRVIGLDLGGMVELGYYTSQPAWVFNVTMLQPFEQLISLDLSLNTIGGLLEEDGSTRLATLKNLQTFVLDYNHFENGYISLGAFTSLEKLSLRGCHLNESNFSIQELKNPRELKELHLRENHFGNSILQELTHMTQLQVLDLRGNHGINNSNLQDFLNLTELQILDLSNTDSYGSIQGICKLKNILQVYLQGNQFTGQIPLCLSNCSSLQLLDLSENHFEGKFSLSFFANFTKLRSLDLSWNPLVVHTEDSLWHPSFQLQHLGLQRCNLNEPDGTIPEFLRLQHDLSEVLLSDNHLVGSFPTWLITNSPHLQVLELQNNSFTGYLKLPSYTWQGLQTLDISGNKFQGTLPNNIGHVFPQLQYLIVAENHFEGTVPNSIAHMSQLQMLDLSHNNFSGELPTQLLSNCTNFEIMKLNDNHLQGEIVPEHMNLRRLMWLDVSNNNFGGTIKDALLKSSDLLYLDMSKNKVTGQLPNFIGNFQYLWGISLSSNNLQGHIPIEICKLRLSHLDLSENNFTGPIPSCSNFVYLEYLHLHSNSLTGPIPTVLSRCSNLTTLDLWSNKLSGIIPPWIGMLVSLQVLLLAGNDLHGQIPQELCQLQNINILDLSHNHLSGEILTCFLNMSFGVRNMTKDDLFLWSTEVYSTPDEVKVVVKNQYLSYTGLIRGLMSALDLSCNNLSGMIPLELGGLTHLQSLNLSHNWLFGSIPSSFSNLKAVEGLDLSFNNLSGMIPNQLAGLYSLEIFNVSYNNLSGRTPEAEQFGHFDETSYYGNPRLCVSLVNKSCGLELPNALPPLTNTTSDEDEDGDGGGLDMEDFLWSFGVTSFVAFLATIAVLAINPRWREAWFDFVEWHILWWLL